MTVVHDWTTDKCELVIWDAKDLSVVSRVPTKDRIPNGFHCAFIPEADLNM